MKFGRLTSADRRHQMRVDCCGLQDADLGELDQALTLQVALSCTEYLHHPMHHEKVNE